MDRCGCVLHVLWPQKSSGHGAKALHHCRPLSDPILFHKFNSINIALVRIVTYTSVSNGGKWSDLQPHSWLGKRDISITSNSEYRTTDQSTVLINRSRVFKLLEKALCVGSFPRFSVLAESHNHNTWNCYVLHTSAKTQRPQKLELEPFQAIKHTCNNGQDQMDFSTMAWQDKPPT